MTTFSIDNKGLSRVCVADLGEGDVVVLGDPYRVQSVSYWKGSIIVTFIPNSRISFPKKDSVFIIK